MSEYENTTNNDANSSLLDVNQLWPINQAALVSGVTTRTLRYYDETGLVKPTETSVGGERWYDWPTLVQLQFVIMLRDAGLSVADIAAIVQPGTHDIRQAIDDKTEDMHRQIAAIQHKLQVLHNLSDLCDDNGDIPQMRQTASNTALAQYGIVAAQQWEQLSDEQRKQVEQAHDDAERHARETMLADAKQWEQLFNTGVSPDSTEAQQLAERIIQEAARTVLPAGQPSAATAPDTDSSSSAMPLSAMLGAIRTALTGDPRFADPCGAALYGSKACADFVNEATRIHAQHVAERFANDARPDSTHK
ncbi:MerR family transcriptional regulator [Bifidobacterium hapali]|uniref:MerR family transcriptional regulator n=1 Tax=Bifidobacterium hapali TaxID=1630172 RepID=A0A261FZ44_9BIFI|nr:MerR family transcriptional regulator [Bifidobacterium hapali]OZG64451.1 MerR family transcriptional regulator [Bifidobacterium hapali]